MRHFILNKTLAVPTIFFFLLCIKGGDLASWVMESTNLASWLEANKLSISYSGADFSILPAMAVIAGMISVSLLIHLTIEMAFYVFDAITAKPAVSGAVEEKIATHTDLQSVKQEPTITLQPSENSNDQDKH